MKISIVIPAYNEEENIADCLDALCTQDRTDFEVIVVDNNSKDNTASIAKGYSSKLDITVIPEVRQSRGIARKTGFNHAKGEIVLSTDADAVVPPNWVSHLVSMFDRHPNAVAVTTGSYINDCGWLKNTTYNLLHPPIMYTYRLVFRHYFLCGFSFGIYKSIYDEVGGFRIDIDGEEDVDLALRVRKKGKILYDSQVPVLFSGRRFKHGLLKAYLEYFSLWFKIIILKQTNNRLTDKR